MLSHPGMSAPTWSASPGAAWSPSTWPRPTRSGCDRRRAGQHGHRRPHGAPASPGVLMRMIYPGRYTDPDLLGNGPRRTCTRTACSDPGQISARMHGHQRHPVRPAATLSAHRRARWTSVPSPAAATGAHAHRLRERRPPHPAGRRPPTHRSPRPAPAHFQRRRSRPGHRGGPARAVTDVSSTRPAHLVRGRAASGTGPPRDGLRDEALHRKEPRGRTPAAGTAPRAAAGPSPVRRVRAVCIQETRMTTSGAPGARRAGTHVVPLLQDPQAGPSG